MNIFWALSYLLFLSQTTFADPYARFEDLPLKDQTQWAKQAQATVPIYFASGLNCSAVIIGPHGEALTNLHCFEKCLSTMGVAQPQPLVGADMSKMQVDNSKLPVTCPIESSKLPDSKVQNAEILHVFGPGWLSPRENLNQFINASPLDFLNLVTQGFEGSGDLVLVRLPVNHKSCISLGSADFTAPAPQELVSLAYPILVRKLDDNPMGNVLFTLGTKLLWSKGAASANPETLELYLSGELNPNKDIIVAPGLIISSTDAEEGSSGSPLFNQAGKLVAITRGNWKGYVTEYVPWTSGAIDLSVHKSWIQSNIDGLETCH